MKENLNRKIVADTEIDTIIPCDDPNAPLFAFVTGADLGGRILRKGYSLHRPEVDHMNVALALTADAPTLPVQFDLVQSHSADTHVDPALDNLPPDIDPTVERRASILIVPPDYEQFAVSAGTEVVDPMTAKLTPVDAETMVVAADRTPSGIKFPWLGRQIVTHDQLEQRQTYIPRG